MRDEMLLKKIGIIHSEYQDRVNTPRQGKYSDRESIIEVFEEYQIALNGLGNVKSIIVLYWGDKAKRETLQTVPPHLTEELGVFSTRAPNRPNPIAICVCEIVVINKNKITVMDCQH